MEQTLSGKRVVVVGGTSGMGLGAVRAAAAAGADVIAAGRRPASSREATTSQDDGDRITHKVVDVTSESSVRALFDEVGETDHVFVTATPAGASGKFLEQDVAAAQTFMHGKFFGTWACARYAAPRLRAGGSITFLTGVASVRPRVGISMVSATFAALEALSRALALDLAPLRVNTIRPGFIDSDMWNFLDPAGREQMRDKVRTLFPVRRVGTIDDIGHAAVFLMTNPYVTGTILDVTGGEPLVDAF